MNKVCYTAIIGNYEELKTPTIIPAGWDFVLFTDQDIKSDLYRIEKVDFSGHITDPQRKARYIKILPHVVLPQYKYSLWLDASFQIHIDLNVLWHRWFKPPFSAPSHPIRNCVYREIASCLANRRGDEGQLVRQREVYKAAKVPEFNGIITSGVLLRENCPSVRSLGDAWWTELDAHSARDQVSFARVSRGYPVNTFIWDYSQARDLTYKKHYHLRH